MIARSFHGYKAAPSDYVASGTFDKAKALGSHIAQGDRVFVPGAFSVPVYDQGDIGSCVANAWCAGAEMLMPRPVLLSRLDLYRKCRRRDGSYPEDAGTSAQTAFEILRDVGVCREDLFQYDGREKGTWNDGPGLTARQDGWDHRIDAAHRIAIKSAAQVSADVYASIVAGRPVAIGGQVGRQYMDYFSEIQDSDPATVVAFGEHHALQGGHERLLIGAWQRPTELWFLERNSWGTGGGVSEFPGHCWIKVPCLMQSDELFSIYAAPKEG